MRYASILLLFLTCTAFASEPRLVYHLPEISEDAIRVFLVRHGETYHNADPTISRDSEKYNELTDKGIQQSQAIGRILKDQPIVQAYSSDTDRTWKTLKLMNLPQDKTIEASRNSSFNKITVGIKENGEPGTFSWRLRLWDQGIDPSPQAGESMDEAMRRVFQPIVKEKKAKGKAMVVVSHGDIIAGFAGTSIGVPAWECWERFRSNTGSITVLDVYNNTISLQYFNLNPLKQMKFE